MRIFPRADVNTLQVGRVSELALYTDSTNKPGSGAFDGSNVLIATGVFDSNNGDDSWHFGDPTLGQLALNVANAGAASLVVHSEVHIRHGPHRLHGLQPGRPSG